MNQYKIRIAHDHGEVTLIVTATSISAARHIVKTAESCPDQAIVSVFPIPLIRHYRWER